MLVTKHDGSHKLASLSELTVEVALHLRHLRHQHQDQGGPRLSPLTRFHWDDVGRSSIAAIRLQDEHGDKGVALKVALQCYPIVFLQRDAPDFTTLPTNMKIKGIGEDAEVHVASHEGARVDCYRGKDPLLFRDGQLQFLVNIDLLILRALTRTIIFVVACIAHYLGCVVSW